MALGQSIFNIPQFIGNMSGGARFPVQQMVEYGKELRDNLVWQYPILPGALMTYQQIASSREVKISAPTAIAASRAADWLNEAVCYNLDGSIDYGYSSILKRRVMDYLCVGRTAYNLGDDELEYIDPVHLRFVFGDNPYWYHQFTNVNYKPEELAINHPYPLGSSGWFMSPVAPIIQKAILAWLLDEHDRASADGRKIRDITIAGSTELADSLIEAMQQSLELWSGADVTKKGVPVAHLTTMPPSGKVSDMISTLGLANIPESFNRNDFEFGYVNVIAANLGLALRHFWNSEKATNRALEDMQESRQLQKGPNEFIRTEQRILNNHPLGIKRFGLKVRMGFIEEADVQTKLANSTVLKGYSDALVSFAQVFTGTINGKAFLAWLQSEDVLPPDLELITDVGTMVSEDRLPTNEGNPAVNTQPEATPLTSGAKSQEKSLDYGEISVDLEGKVIERRLKPYPVAKMISDEIEADPDYQKALEEPKIDFNEILKLAHQDNYSRFMEKSMEDINKIDDPYYQRMLQESRNLSFDELSAHHHFAIAWMVNNA